MGERGPHASRVTRETRLAEGLEMLYQSFKYFSNHGIHENEILEYTNLLYGRTLFEYSDEDSYCIFEMSCGQAIMRSAFL